ncbi:hypothetical protein PUN28_011359 [Cardiocondyla obscurior]|uniref:Secreted protein n=1 Tax=Cardiocondyla obscurior TaxID=286306 RepID=A0AAW2FIJ8_9HYME
MMRVRYYDRRSSRPDLLTNLVAFAVLIYFRAATCDPAHSSAINFGRYYRQRVAKLRESFRRVARRTSSGSRVN